MIYESRRYECFSGKLPVLQVMMETMAGEAVAVAALNSFR